MLIRRHCGGMNEEAEIEFGNESGEHTRPACRDGRLAEDLPVHDESRHRERTRSIKKNGTLLCSSRPIAAVSIFWFQRFNFGPVP